jgi:hypothetical protein
MLAETRPAGLGRLIIQSIYNMLKPGDIKTRLVSSKQMVLKGAARNHGEITVWDHAVASISALIT